MNIGNPKAAAHFAVDLQCWFTAKPEHNTNSKLKFLIHALLCMWICNSQVIVHINNDVLFQI